MSESIGPLSQFAEGVWTAQTPVSIVGMKLSSSMTVLRLKDNKLLLYSPIEMTPECKEAVDSLGQVTHLYAPNLFHHMFVKSWADEYPDAKVHAPAGLEKKQPNLRMERLHNSEPEPDFSEVVEEFPIKGFRLIETALLYRPTKTVLVADLVHNVGRPEGGWTKFYTKTMGFYDRVALSRMIRWTAFSDKKAAKRSIEHLLSQDFDSLIVGHGTPLESDAKEILRQALEWLL